VAADDKGFAIFPNRESGEAAHETLIKSNRYSGLTLQQFAGKYAEGSSDWMRTVGRELGIGPGDVVNNQDPRLAGAIRKAEGTGGGAKTPADASQQPPPSGGPAPITSGAMNAPSGDAPAAFIMHHTGGRGGPANVVSDWRTNRPGIGTQYIMDREGVVHDVKKEFGYGGTGNIITGSGAGRGLSNKNIVGMEVVATSDKDVTPAQRDAAKRFIAENYPNTPVFGHGEVNPGHREASEGMTIVNAIRAGRSSVTGGVDADWATAKQGKLDTATLAAAARKAIDGSRSVDVNATGKLTATINAPPGAKVEASGEGLFKNTEVNRQTQMQPAAVGPEIGGGGDF
jgi:hypothetical protein